MAMLPRWQSEVERWPVRASALSVASPRGWHAEVGHVGHVVLRARLDLELHDLIVIAATLNLAAAAQEELALGAVELGAAVDVVGIVGIPDPLLEDQLLAMPDWPSPG